MASSENCVSDRYRGASGPNSSVGNPSGGAAPGAASPAVGGGSATAKQNFTAIRYGNDHGSISMGSIDEKGAVTSSVKLQAADGRHQLNMEKDGQRKGWTSISSPGNFQVVCGEDNDPKAESLMMCSKNGNISFVAESGTLRIQADNIEIIATGSGKNGNIKMQANSNVSVDAPKFLVNAANSFRLVTPQTGEVIANGVLKMYGSIIQGVTDACALKDSKNGHQSYQIKNNTL